MIVMLRWLPRVGSAMLSRTARMAMSAAVAGPLVLAGLGSGGAQAADSLRPASAPASASPPTLCETAVTSAEYTARLPVRLLGAIAAVESGRLDTTTGLVRPWPWTINAEGIGQFFATKAEAITAVRTLQARGVRSIDVGCLQVNLMFHPDAFASLDQAFDPIANARYAARFLNALYGAARDWPQAIGAYHSQTPALGAGYRMLVMDRWQQPSLAQTELAHPAYRDFASPQTAYNAFPSANQVYGAFVTRR